MQVNKNDIISIYVAYVDISGGKNRPVLVIENDKDTITFFKITTKFAKKSLIIQKNYYPIINWKECGLNRKSYIDTGMAAQVNKSDLNRIFKIGELDLKDINGLNNFQKQKMEQQN